MKKISILGILAIISTPAMAESVPDNGVMTKDKTYTESCNNTTLGTYTGPANMTAQYTANTYNCEEGLYLGVGDANTEPQCEICPRGSYCPGVNDITYADNMTDVGINKCPSDYPNSGGFAVTADSCYSSCAVGLFPHATSVSGEMYKGGLNSCVPTRCEDGWHVKDDANGPDLAALLGNTDETGRRAWRKGSGSAVDSWGSCSSSTEEACKHLSDKPLAFAVNFGPNGMVTGHGMCSTVVPKFTDDVEYIYDVVDETSKYIDGAGAGTCFCKLDSYTTVGGQKQNLDGVWFATSGFREDCANDCGDQCASAVGYGFGTHGTRIGALNSAKPRPICEANTIELNWDGVTDAGDAATCSYSGDLKTPATAPVKKGYTFTGWKVNK